MPSKVSKQTTNDHSVDFLTSNKDVAVMNPMIVEKCFSPHAIIVKKNFFFYTHLLLPACNVQ